MAKRTKTTAPKYRQRIVRNKSSRLGAPIQAIAVHSTESADIPGWDDLDSIYNWFNNPASQASSHIGIDGEGHTELWVPPSMKAWTILSLNPVTFNIEFIGRAAQSSKAWEEDQYKEGAKWAAYIGLEHNIPMQRGVVKNVNGFPVITKRGIITHKQLTDAGFGTHQDPGPQFPMGQFIEASQWYKKNGWFA
jgi:N-acetyl-anhydromuramyl-L-alanine amidase AmpD